MSQGYGQGMGLGGISPITLGDVTGPAKKFPNHKITINIYGAEGGHIVDIGRAHEGELHIISENEDFDRALGKIITHYKLKQE